MIKDNIIFENEQEKSDYDKYLTVRGLGVYKDVYETLSILGESYIISFYDFMGFIRYDKYLREKLYKYLSVMEEYLRDQLFKQIEFSGDRIIQRCSDFDLKQFKKNGPSQYGTNFYKCAKLEFYPIQYLYKEFNLTLPTADNVSLHIVKIKSLRNIVMHNSMLLVNQNEKEPTKTKIQKHLSAIEEFIHSLFMLLPDNYKKGLLKDLKLANLDKANNCVKSRYISLNLEVIKNGIQK